MRLLRALGVACLALCPMLAGCNIIGPLGFLLGPRQIQKAECELTKERLAILVDTARPAEDSPVFAQALHNKLVQIFREKEINSQVVPWEEVVRLRQREPDFGRWSIQRAGRALKAREVLYVRVDRLQLLESVGSPVMTPHVWLRVKLIAADELSSLARRWPPQEERRGREIDCGRQTREATDTVAVDSEAAKLGKDVAQFIAMPFYDVDLEEKVPRER